MPVFASTADLLASFIVPAIIAILGTYAYTLVCGWVNELRVWLTGPASEDFRHQLVWTLAIAVLHLTSLVTAVVMAVPPLRNAYDRRIARYIDAVLAEEVVS